MKFKKGDRVVCTKSVWETDLGRVGQLGIVDRDQDGDCVHVSLDGGRSLVLSADRFKRAFQVGDRVRLIQDCWSLPYGRKGDVGTVTGFAGGTPVVDGIGDDDDGGGPRSKRHATPGWAVVAGLLEFVVDDEALPFRDPARKFRYMSDALAPDTAKPNYYRFSVKGVDMDVTDLIQALGLGFEEGNVLKYVIRAGRKTESVTEDLNKAAEYIRRRLEREPK